MADVKRLSGVVDVENKEDFLRFGDSRASRQLRTFCDSAVASFEFAAGEPGLGSCPVTCTTALSIARARARQRNAAEVGGSVLPLVGLPGAPTVAEQRLRASCP